MDLFLFLQFFRLLCSYNIYSCQFTQVIQRNEKVKRTKYLLGSSCAQGTLLYIHHILPAYNNPPMQVALQYSHFSDQDVKAQRVHMSFLPYLTRKQISAELGTLYLCALKPELFPHPYLLSWSHFICKEFLLKAFHALPVTLFVYDLSPSLDCKLPEGRDHVYFSVVS